MGDSLKQAKYLNAVIATPSVSFTYDTNFNRPPSMTDGIGTTTYAYNTITVPPALSAGRLPTVTGTLPNSTVSYNYDQLSNPLCPPSSFFVLRSSFSLLPAYSL
jgi:hypothetical protein